MRIQIDFDWAALQPVVSTALEGAHILKASAGNLLRLAVTTQGSAGYLMVFDATTAPADGTVAPKLCRSVAAYSTLEIDHSLVPDRFATGIVAVFSTTGPFTKTVSPTAFFEASVQ